MFGLSTELITKGKLATVKRFESADFLSVSPSSEPSDEGLAFKKSALSNLFTVANLPLVINSVDS